MSINLKNTFVRAAAGVASLALATAIATSSYAAPPKVDNDPNSQWSRLSAHKEWITRMYHEQKDAAGNVTSKQFCCNIGDGRIVDDKDVRIDPTTGHYQVYVTQEVFGNMVSKDHWVDIPPENILLGDESKKYCDEYNKSAAANDLSCRAPEDAVLWYNSSYDRPYCFWAKPTAG